MRFILFDGFWFVYTPFISMVKFQFIAQFPVDHFSYPVVSILTLLLRYFAIFAYNVLYLLRIIDFGLNIFGLYGIISCYQ